MNDPGILRELVRRYLDVCGRPVQTERRRLWRAHNSLKPTRPPIYVRAFAWDEMPESACVCQDPVLRTAEGHLRHALFWDTLNDDSVFEPWVPIRAVHITPPQGLWGLPVQWHGGDEPGGARQIDPPIKDPEDAAKLVKPRHQIDEATTADRVHRLRDAVGDLIPVCLDRSPVYRLWAGDLSTYLGFLRGIQPMMLDMMDRPEWLHGVLAFMRDGVLSAQAEAERAGDWALCAQQNQAMPYAEELADPSADPAPVKRSQLWTFCASQETTLVGPDMFYEFMLQYQIPILAPFGLAAYGCCEDLTRKIDYLRRIPNLRRIAVSPMANVAKCAAQIGRDYVVSYRPSPADMVSYGFDENRIRNILRRDLTFCRDTHVDITLKDVETVQQDPHRVRRWVEIARQVIDEVWG